MKKALMYGAAALALVACQSNTNKTETMNEPETKAAETVTPITDYPNILVVVDVQRDFFDPSGSLYVSGSEVLPAKIAAIADNYDAVVFTLDWHPADHCSFNDQGGMWPSHCVAFTQGAGLADVFAPVIKSKPNEIFLKGTDPNKEQFGAFEDLSDYPELEGWLKGCRSIDVCGIAGDYCVKESTNNILKYADASKVSILVDCVRSIDDGSALKAFIAEKGISTK